MGVVVLMYHAVVGSDAELARLAPEHRPYAVWAGTLRRHLALLADEGLPVIDPAHAIGGRLPRRGVVLTFDDGYHGHAAHVLPLLCECGVNAAFFITTGLVGQGAAAISWAQVRQLADAGMVVGAHGVTHRFFDDLCEREARAEFADARRQLEDETGQRVCQMSFPGGRFRRGQLRLGREAGFTSFHTSRVAACRKGAAWPAVLVPRLAVRASTTDECFLRWARAEPLALSLTAAAAGVKLGGRKVLGNRLYHRLYEALHA